MLTISQLRRVEVAVLDLDELGLLAASLAATELGYKEVGIELPEAFKNAKVVVLDELKVRTRDEKQRKLATLQARVSSLKTREEKRAEYEAEIAKLQAELA